MTDRCKTDEEFSKELYKQLFKNRMSNNWSKPTAWAVASYPREQTTWEKILELCEELSGMNPGAKYVIRTHGEGEHSLVLWACGAPYETLVIERIPETDFVKRLETEVANHRKPLEVTLEEAKEAYEALGKLWTAEYEPSWNTLRLFISQQKVKESE